MKQFSPALTLLLVIASIFISDVVLGSDLWKTVQGLADKGVLPRFSNESDGLHIRPPGSRNELVLRTVSSSSNSNSNSSSASSSSSTFTSTTSSSYPSRTYRSDVRTLVPKALSSSGYLSAQELPNETLAMAAVLSLCSYHDRHSTNETRSILETYCNGTNSELLHRVPGSSIKHIYDGESTHIGLVLCQPGRCTWISLAGTQGLKDAWTGAKGFLDSAIKGTGETVHTGYAEYAKTVAGAVRKVLKDKDFDNEVILCGHSSGAAMCLLITEEIYQLQYMSRANKSNQLKWITFGAPAFANPSSSRSIPPGYNSTNHIRIYNSGDYLVKEGLLGTGFKHGHSPALSLDEERVTLGNEIAETEQNYPLTKLASMKGMNKGAIEKALQEEELSSREDMSGDLSGTGRTDFEVDDFELFKRVGTMAAKQVKGVKTSHSMAGYTFAVMELNDRKQK